MKKFRNFLKGLALTMSQVLGSDCAILTDVSADMEHVDGKATGKQFGTKYTVVCPGAKYFEVVVKVPDMVPVITQEALDTAANPVFITFEGFVGHIYAVNDNMGVTCRADKAVLVSGRGKGHEKSV